MTSNGAAFAQRRRSTSTEDLFGSGPIGQKVAVAELSDLHVDEECLCFRSAGAEVALELGAVAAQRWHHALVAPPPSLASKLGVGPKNPIFVPRPVTDPLLREALADATVGVVGDANQGLIEAHDRAGLEDGLATLAGTAPGDTVWVVYRKGRTSDLGEAAVRAVMRDQASLTSKSPPFPRPLPPRNTFFVVVPE